MACDIDQIPVSNARWSERPSASGMEQVREFLELIDRRSVDRVIVATNFTFWRCQPSKERIHPAYEVSSVGAWSPSLDEDLDPSTGVKWVGHVCA